MKTVVFAYHNMGVLGIKALHRAGFDIPLVFTHRDSAEENIWFNSVDRLCRQKGIKCVKPESSNTREWTAWIKAESPDIIFSFYYREMLSKEIIETPLSGAYNLHGSYLPAYRGRCPVNWVLINGEKHTGVTLHEMVEKPDAGPIVAKKKVAIAHDDTALTLFRKLEQAADVMLAHILPQIKRGEFQKTYQDLSLGSYHKGRKPGDGRISWQKPAEKIYNLVRGITYPYPGAFCFHAGKKMILWQVLPHAKASSAPGRIKIAGSRVLFGTTEGSVEPVEAEIDGRNLKGDNLLSYFKNHEGEYLQ